MTLNPWLETLGALLLAVGGGWLGWRASKWPRPWWVLGYAPPLALIVLIALGRRFDALGFAPVISDLLAGRREFALLAAALPMLFMCRLPRMPVARQRRAVAVLMALSTLGMAGPAFMGPALVQGRLATLGRQNNPDAVCRQSTFYNCGPASAVTALHRLGIEATEGELAILARTSPLFGTELDGLQRAIEAKGALCQVRRFGAVADLAEYPAALTVIKLNVYVHHFVAVLEVTPDKVVLGDPLAGRTEHTVAEFRRIWRPVGLTLRSAVAAGAAAPTLKRTARGQ